MRALKRLPEVSPLHNGSLESLLAQFSVTALELNPSLGISEFARRLTAHTAEMLGAHAVALALGREPEWEIAAICGPAQRWGQSVKRNLATALARQTGIPEYPLRSGTARALFGTELAEALGWRNVVLARLKVGDGVLLGVLCLADLAHDLSETERQILEALAGHASIALENVRLFSRIEHSRRQWVEDVDAISDFIVAHDNAGRVLRLNRALADQLGVPPSEAVGRNISEIGLLGTPGSTLPGKPAPVGRCPLCRNSASTRDEFIHVAKERTYIVSSSRTSGEEGDGTEPRVVHVLKDVTDRREAERRYRHERDFNRNILNNTKSMILVLDTAGLISYANRRCFEAGYGERELLGHRFVEFVPTARRSTLTGALEQTLEGAALENLEVPLVRGNGSVGLFLVSLSPMRDDQGEINSVVVVMADVTETADLQAKLMHTEKMAALGQLVSGVAHEVNNPLAAIVGFTDLLLENRAVPESAKGDLRVILEEAQRTRVIVKNLLSFARQMPPQREPVRVNDVLEQTLKLRSYDLSKHAVEISEHYAVDLPLTIGDPHQLQQVFLNILNNAYDAVQEVRRPGKIEISTLQCDGRVEITFRDNGPGIAHPDRIFDPFFTTKEVGKGTGLGLSICYGIVRAHEGEIIARNNPDGIGSTFFVRLPVAPGAALS